MKPFRFCQPATVDEACAVLAEQGEAARVIAGGTDLVLELNEGRAAPEWVVDISRLHELKYVTVADGVVRIGALSTFSELEENAYLREKVKVLHTAAEGMGSPQIRNLATLGGNLVNASVAGDSLGSMTALDASVVLQSVRGKRVMKLSAFYGGRDKTEIRPDELLTQVFFDAPDERTATSFVKLAKREALAIVVIDACGVVALGEDGRCAKAQVAVGAVGRYPFRVAAVEEALLGKPLTRQGCMSTLPLLSQAVQQSIANRPSVTYKRESVMSIAETMYDQILTDLHCS